MQAIDAMKPALTRQEASLLTARTRTLSGGAALREARRGFEGMREKCLGKDEACADALKAASIETDAAMPGSRGGSIAGRAILRQVRWIAR